MPPNEVFLSHASQNAEFAATLADEIRRHGVPVWYSTTNLMAAQQWMDEIGSALQRCDWLVVVLSPESVNSMWVKREVSYALQQARYEGRIIPLLYEDCDIERLSWVLGMIQRIDGRAGLVEACRDILRVWGIGYQHVE